MTQTTKRLSLDEALRAARETRALEIGEGAISGTPRVFREHFGDRPAVLVTDPDSLMAAGDAVLDAFRSAQCPSIEPFIFRSDDLYAEHRFVVELETALRQHSAIPVAVGSGTINDLTKLAAHRTGRPYMCVATAASMDGYTAFGASITHEGSKQTFDCPAPTAVVADLNVIAAAPVEMNAWGYADLLAKVTAGADWILAAALDVEPIDSLAWDIVQGGLRDATSDPARVRQGDRGAVGKLVEGLMLGGFAMQATKSSRPASGAEHQFSHLWDMQHHTHNGYAPSHGLKVGIGTLAVTALYESLLSQPLEKLDVERCCEGWPDESAWVEHASKLFAEGELRTVAVREIRAKYTPMSELRAQLERLRTVWPELRESLRTQLIPFTTLKSMLQAAGAATVPEEIGISRKRLRDSFRQAFFIRRRFTVLDLAVRTRLLDDSVAELFGSGGVWPIES
ncbi:sn-glycerol-1-phosphate dehydrogenase [Verrucomicrobiota bacterium sgz303538]